MEIPPDVQNKLKCSKCEGLLSCGPVYIIHETGGAICGRCTKQHQPDVETSTASRNCPYEATASLLSFPCTFAARGCPETLKFALGHPPHELSCKFRSFNCPIVASETDAACNWNGSWLNLKQHCDDKHPLNVFENPCNPPRINLSSTNIQTYLISAFTFLFLLRFKLCVASGHLFHSVWMFGNPDFLPKFTFTLDIEANGMKFSKLDAVCSPGDVIRQDPTNIATTIDNLLRVLNGLYGQSTVTVKIHALFKFCLSCLNAIENDSNAKFCRTCEGKLKKCKFYRKNCLFVDVNKKKCEKHENIFCEYQRKCCKCGVSFNGGSLIEHLASPASCQNVVRASIEAVVRLTPSTCSDYIIFNSDVFGSVVCMYKLSYSNLDVSFYTSLPSHELRNLKCSVELVEPRTKHTQVLTAKYLTDNWRDWHVSKEMHSLFSLDDCGIDIKVNIEKN